MTMTYIGIRPSSECTGKNYERKYSHSKMVNGKMIDYYEVVRIDEINDTIPMNHKLIKELTEALA